MTKENQTVEVLSEELADLFHNNDMGSYAKRVVELSNTYSGETVSDILKKSKGKRVRKHLNVG